MAGPRAQPSANGTVAPSVRRRLAAAMYEGILLFGVVFIAAYLFSALAQYRGTPDSPLRHAFQLAIFGAVGAYFVWCWRHGGQTLPMKTWKFRVVDRDGGTPGLARCWLRYAAAWIGLLAAAATYKAVVFATGFGTGKPSYAAFALVLPIACANVLWALFDRERQFLHDRVAGTRLVRIA